MLTWIENLLSSSNDPSHVNFFIYFNHFAKLYDRLKIYQLLQSTAVRHSGRRAPRR
jgi:hypothetical protein